jgi:hypothetical protein
MFKKRAWKIPISARESRVSHGSMEGRIPIEFFGVMVSQAREIKRLTLRSRRP